MLPVSPPLVKSGLKPLSPRLIPLTLNLLKDAPPQAQGTANPAPYRQSVSPYPVKPTPYRHSRVSGNPERRYLTARPAPYRQSAPYRHSRVSGNPERYCVRKAGLWQGISGFPLTRE